MDDRPYIDEHPDDTRARQLSNRGLFLALLPLVTFGGCTVALAQESEVLLSFALVAWGVSCVLAFIGGALGLRSRRYRKTKRGRAAAILGFTMPFVTATLGFFIGVAMIPFQRGRAFRRRGRARLPKSTEREGWHATDPRPLPSPAEETEAIAAGWRAMAATETASIASFASLSHQLLAVGAPSELIELAHRDAIDEIVHARLCYDVARDLDGRALGPDAFPDAAMALDRKPTLRSLARECLRESCVLEAASARAAEMLAERATDPRMAATLRTIARDEARHAEHGWQMLAWLQGAMDGADPGSADVLARLRESVPRAVVDHDRHEPYGLAGPTLWTEAVHRALEDAERRLAAPASLAA